MAAKRRKIPRDSKKGETRLSRIRTSMRKRIKNVSGTELIRGRRFTIRGTKKPGWTTIYEVLVEFKSNGREIFHVHGSFDDVKEEMRRDKMTRKGIRLLVEVAKKTDPEQPIRISN